ncbi:malectin domain-containing carbohydrate-binding protein [Alteromonas flava]|uniref:malectin domain-containing carbohydrate-binding protein n=1 Tax=Alteromonas flava TaxID=2048003 RepID=UPI000C285178|nr:malectin domain-containing carbohydrate-binding protein [Alteromonas flava]
MLQAVRLPLLILLTFVVYLAGCTQSTDDKTQLNATPQITTPFADGVVAAINFGGPAYRGKDGVEYAADDLSLAADKGKSEEIKGTQDPELYQSYRVSRESDLLINLPVENGRYAVTFKFAEPDDIAVGERVFDILAEDDVVVEQLDVRLARDNQPVSALVRSVYGVNVNDQTLNIHLKAIQGAPLIHAIIVRKQAIEDERAWQLVWNDEFSNDGAPDPNKWSFDIWPARKVNDEDQAYTDRSKNARVENGHLIIEAHKETYANAEYTSARLHNQGKGDFLYGKVEVRARVPKGQGTWAAAWMLPSNPFKYATKCGAGEDWQGSSTCDAWPNSGEIDILEHVGYDMQTVHGTVHNKAYYWMNWQQRKASIEGQSVDTEFHLYSLEWSPEYIIISFDEVPYFYYENDGTGWESWPFDHPYHVILNLAIGGAWGRAGGPIDDSIFPVRMEVDYVRIYQLAQ